ncbi:MAG TPA: 50S ribosomal protein L35 [bacterium]|nr:50S ribosomal protein L35 [bacterium]
MKLKTHKATIKRIKLTGTGKILRSQASVSHLLSHKSARANTPLALSSNDTKKIKKLAPYLNK